MKNQVQVYFRIRLYLLFNVLLKTAHTNNVNYDRVKRLMLYHKSIIIQTENDNYKLGINYYLFTLPITYLIHSGLKKDI
jgi:hypothetical protein